MLRHKLILAFSVVALSAFAPAKHHFTALEQQQISIETPGLFEHSDAFNVDFSSLGKDHYSFPLPVGKATLNNNNTLTIVTTEGDAVKAMFDGVVRLSRKHDEMGHVIVVRHRNGLETVYANNAQNLVEVGQSVKAGHTIAIVGSKEGRVYTEFSIMVNGCRINPSTIVDINSHNLRKQVLMCRRNGSHVDVSSKGSKAVVDDEDIMNVNPFEKKSTFELNLAELDASRWAFPLPGAKVISPYGGRRRHTGVDLKTKPNDNIVAAFNGVVTRSGPYYGYGNCIVVKHAYGLETLYSHQSKNLVKVGDKVKAGQVIGLTGRTGRATTEHLHFEVMFKGRRMNPTTVFDCTNRTIRKVTLVLNKNGAVSTRKHS
ncbi:MAG: peptidoglycan DD-metalloendopeptidase family protein [Prevotella sp.]